MNIDDNIYKDVISFLDDATEIHECDEYSGDCLVGCRACEAFKLLQKLGLYLTKTCPDCGRIRPMNPPSSCPCLLLGKQKCQNTEKSQ